MSDRDRNAPSRVAIPVGSNTTSSSAHGIKQRSRPAFGKRHRANGGSMYDEASDSENESGDDRDKKRHGRQETILTYGGDDDLSDKDSSSKRHKSHREHRSGHHDDRNDDDISRRRRSEVRSPDRRHRGDKDRRARAPGQKDDQQEEEDNKQPVQWGLTINMKGAKGGSRARDTSYKSNPRGQGEGDRSSPEDSKDNKPATKKSIDDEALDALMGTTPVPKKRKLDDLGPAAADREPQAEDYQAVPIDDFGASLLRGLGWDGKMRGKVREVKRHANLTGLGAKDIKGNEDLAAWNPKGVVKKDPRPVRLNDYRKEEDKKRQRLDDRRGDNSYRRELERDRERDRGRDR